MRLIVPICFCVPALLSAYSCTRSGEAASHKQPITYNHQVHVEENDMECTDCHLYVETRARATIPNIEVCGECHSDEPMTESAEEQKVVDYVSRGEKIPWLKIYRVPSHVYFSHRRHTALGEIACATCHGDMERMTTPPPKPAVPISMDRCMGCHEQNQVSNDCTRCHR
jgi:hypothetical protein